MWYKAQHDSLKLKSRRIENCSAAYRRRRRKVVYISSFKLFTRVAGAVIRYKSLGAVSCAIFNLITPCRTFDNMVREANCRNIRLVHIKIAFILANTVILHCSSNCNCIYVPN